MSKEEQGTNREREQAENSSRDAEETTGETLEKTVKKSGISSLILPDLNDHERLFALDDLEGDSEGVVEVSLDTLEPLTVPLLSEDEIGALTDEQRENYLAPFLERFKRAHVVQHLDTRLDSVFFSFKGLTRIDTAPLSSATFAAGENAQYTYEPSDPHKYVGRVFVEELPAEEVEPGDFSIVKVTLRTVAKLLKRQVPEGEEPAPDDIFTFDELIRLGALQTAPTERERLFIHRLAFPGYPLEEKRHTEQDTLPGIEERHRRRPLTKNLAAITKVAQSLVNPEAFAPDGLVLDITSKSEKRKKVHVDNVLALSWEDIENAELTRDLDHFDTAVWNATQTLGEYGQMTFTRTQLTEAVYGGKRRITPRQETKVDEAIEVLRNVRSKVDFTDEIKKRNIPIGEGGEELSSGVIDGNLLPIVSIELTTTNGRKVKGYKLLSLSPVFQHAKLSGQIVSFPHKLLGTGEGSNTDRNVTIRYAVLTRVFQLKRQGAHISSRMLYESLCSKTNTNTKDRDAVKAVADFVISVLEDLKSLGEIKGYEEITGAKGKREAVDIIV